MGRRAPYCTRASRTPWKVSSCKTLRLAPFLAASLIQMSIVCVRPMRYVVRALVVLSGRALLPAGKSLAGQTQVFLCSQHVRLWIMISSTVVPRSCLPHTVLVILGCFLFFREQIPDGDGEEPPAVCPEDPPAPGGDISPPSRKPAGVWAADHSRVAASAWRCE